MQCMENRYGRLASWVYELDKPIGKSFGDIEYYAQRLRSCTEPILEPAVGNGRVLIPLSKQGHEIDGFDASNEMLEYCRKSCEAHSVHANLTCQRLSSFECSRKYEAIIMPAGSFQLITQYKSAQATLNRFYNYLLPGGRLIVDLDCVELLIQDGDTFRSWQVDDDVKLTLTQGKAAIDHLEQTAESYLRYDHWQNGELLCSELEMFILRWWGIYEYKLLLEAVGFGNVVISGGYEYGRWPTRGDRIVTFEATRD